MQINVGDVDPATGRYTGSFKTFALCGYIRDKVRRACARAAGCGAPAQLPSVRLSSPTRSTRTHGPRLPAAPAPRAQAESDMAFTALVAAAEKKQ